LGANTLSPNSTSNSNLFLQIHHFFSPLPQFGTEAHYLCAKFYYTMSHHTTQFYTSLPPISHFGVSEGFVYLGATIKEKYSHLKLNQYDETNSKLSTNACIQW
jgi:hypothetical protein